jgi:hypothetical protein
VSTQSKPKAPAPAVGSWKDLHALLPLLILVGMVVAWTNLQLSYVWSAVTGSVALAAVLAVLKYLPSKYKESAQADFALALRSSKRAGDLWMAIGVVFLASLVVGSAKVNADKLPRSVSIYRVDGGGGRAREASSRSGKMLVSRNAERSFFVGLPFRRHVTFASSNNEMSRVLTVYPWAVPSVTYPSDFSTMPEVAVLLSPRYRSLLGHGHWLRLVVIRDGAMPKILAEDTLRLFQSRVVAFDTSSMSDESARTLWLPIARDSLSLDAETAQIVVTDWLHRKILRSAEPLIPDQQLRLALLNQNNDTIRIARIILTPGLSHVVLRE